jgi:hypothetical protein
MVSKQFQGITRDKWNDIKTVLHNDAHIDIQDDSGENKTHGIHFSWFYAAAGVLTVTINVPEFGWLLNHAGLHTEQDVMDKFSHWIEGVK